MWNSTPSICFLDKPQKWIVKLDQSNLYLLTFFI